MTAAERAKKVGSAVGAPRRAPNRAVLPRHRIAALKRRNSFRRIARVRHGQPLEAAIGWAMLIANVLDALDEDVSSESIAELAADMGIDLPDSVVQIGLTFRVDREHGYGPGGRLASAEVAGQLLVLTSAERTAAQVADIDAHDESRLQRRRRLDRENKARRKGTGLKPAPVSTEQSKPWVVAGISRATWFRRKRRETDPVASSSNKDLSTITGLDYAGVRASAITTARVSLADPRQPVAPANPEQIKSLTSSRLAPRLMVDVSHASRSRT